MAVSGQTPVVINAPPKADNTSSFKGGVGIGLGITQILIGAIVAIFEIVSFTHHGRIAISFTGLWMGIYFIITGVIGILAGKKKTRCPVIAFLVLSIIAVFTAGFLIVYGSIAMVVQSFYSYREYHRRSIHQDNVLYAMNGGMVICGILEFIIAIISAAFCCAGICCRPSQPMQVMYVNQGHGLYPAMAGSGPQVIVYQQQGQPMGVTGTHQGIPPKQAEAMAGQQMPPSGPPPSY